MKLLESDFRSLHLSNLKPLPTISFYTTHAQADSQYIRPTCCQGSTSTQSKSLPTISLCTTFAQPNFYCIRTTLFQGLTLAQPEIFTFMVK